MAYGIVHFFPGGTKEQYEASLAAVHPDRKTLPKPNIPVLQTDPINEV